MSIPDNTGLDRKVRLHVYGHFLLHEGPPTLREIASTLRVTSEEVAASLLRLDRAHALVLRPESCEILMAMPLSAVPTSFEVGVRNRRWWANCAWDALGVPAMLNSDAEISTFCPDCGEPISISVKAGEVQGDAELIHFAVPAARWWDDIEFT
jgi:hypothetical protein